MIPKSRKKRNPNERLYVSHCANNARQDSAAAGTHPLGALPSRCREQVRDDEAVESFPSFAASFFFSFLNCLQAAGTHEFRLESVFAAKTGLRWSRPCSRTTYLRLLHVEKVRANVESDALRAENVPERHDNVQEERRALPQPNHPVRYAHEQKWIAENEWEVRHYFSTVVARQPAKVAHKRYKKNAKAPYETSEAVNKLRFAVDRHKRESAA